MMLKWQWLCFDSIFEEQFEIQNSSRRKIWEKKNIEIFHENNDTSYYYIGVLMNTM